jgi:Arc/MetJ-type ribon-helix-helix transcriptional regulator
MMYHHTMPKTKVAVTIEADLLGRLDALISSRRFPNRSQAIEAAVEEKLARLRRGRLAQECAKLDPREEKAMAEEGFSADVESWPAF